MSRFNISALRNLGVTAMIAGAAGFAVSAANASTLTLSQLNGGPSAAGIPTTDDSTVATFTFPRAVRDTTVTDVPSGTLNGTAGANSSLSVQTTGGDGFRNRSATTIAPFDFNTNAALQLIANSNADVNRDDAGTFVFIGRSTDLAAIGTTITSLMTFIGAGTEGVEYFQLPFTAYATSIGAADPVTEANLNAGISIPLSEFWTADPDGIGGPLTNNSYRFDSSFDIFLIAMDTSGDGIPDMVTEFGCIDRTGTHQTLPALAASGTSTTLIETVAVLANHQLVDDSSDQTADTVAGTLSAATDFLVGTNATGAGSQSLSTFLTGLAGGPYTVAGFTVSGTGDGDFNKIITIDINPDITDAGAITTLRSRFIGFTPAGGGGEVFSFSGTNPTNTSFAQMAASGDINVDEVQLLQGSGPDFSGDTREIWAAIDLSATPSNVGAADPGQFELWVTDDDGNSFAVASGIAVQSTVPTNVQVPGIDDEDLDGTADDPVIEAASNRVFVRFFLNDTDDSINSDGTWSNEGGDEFLGRETRFATRLQINDAILPLLGNALGATIAADTEEPVEDLARPIMVAFRTASTTTGQCEFVGFLSAIFDEAVSSPDADQMGLAFIGGETISDLTTGLNSDLSIPEIDLEDPSDFEDTLLAIAGGAAATTFVANDTFRFTAPPVPVDGTANDGSTSILAGSGDAPYSFGVNVNAVEGAENLGNTAIGAFDAVEDGEMTAIGGDASDGTPPALLGATSDGGDVLLGFSEDVNNPTGADEAESFFIFNEDGVRLDIENADIDSVFGNIFEVDNVFFDADLEIEVAVFNPGFPITDDNDNANDFTVTKNKFVTITPPAVGFKTNGVAFVDDETNLVTTVVLKTTGQVEIDGSESSFLERLYVRGDDFGSDNGDFDSASDLVSSIDVGVVERNDGCFLFILNMNEECELGQEDFYVQYSDSNDQPSPADSTLVDFNNGSEVASEVIYVQVARPSTPDYEGNPLGETYTGFLDLGPVTEDALGAEISAWIYKPYSECGDVSFVYKGITYTGTIQAIGDDDETLIANGTVLYFHPQLRGDGDDCEGQMSPCGLLNSKPDLDLYQVATLNQTGNGGINGAAGATEIDTQVLLYQNMDPSFVIKPISVTVRTDTTNPSRFTLTGSGISNGSITFLGSFEEIGRTYVTADADANGARPYTLHTRGKKNYLGCPVVFRVRPDSNFSDVEVFLANNTLVRRVTFAADNQADATGSKSFTFANNAPIVFNINADFVHRYPLDNLLEDFNEEWAFIPAAALSPNRTVVNAPGQDFGTSGTLPNRVTAPTGTNGAQVAVNAIVPFPSNTSARGFFVTIDEDNSDRPTILPVRTALAIDTRGVYCGSLRGLNRIAAGYAYAIEFIHDNGFHPEDHVWFAFGELVSNVSGKQLVVTPNATNGGWNILSNNSNTAITSSNAGSPAGNQILVSMDEEFGVRIFIEGSPQFSDFEEVAPNHGYMLFTDTLFTQ